MRLQHGIGLATPVMYNIAYFPKPCGKDPLSLKFFLSYAFVMRPLLGIPCPQRGSLTFPHSRVPESPLTTTFTKMCFCVTINLYMNFEMYLEK